MQAISLDLGTSGIRGQLLDLQTRRVMRTCVTSRNPLPGANIMDHLSFAIEEGADLAHTILVRSINQIIHILAPDDLERIAVCGNPIQFSLFEGIEIRDLAYAGKNLLISQEISPPDRRGHIVSSDEIGLKVDAEVLIPPAVRHEIGADALAMMIKSGFLDHDMSIVTDYGTNAEMALKVGDDIYTGSASAGPAIEGQQIRDGVLASPGAISDIVRLPEGWQGMVLNDRLEPQAGALFSLRANTLKLRGVRAKGITGTGVIALVYAGLKEGRIVLPNIVGNEIALDRGVRFTGQDLLEAGKAIGAIRAGHMTLMVEAGMDPRDLDTVYMAGASGTYVDATKARAVGMVPSTAKKIVQIGNTSLELAKDLAFEPDLVDELNDLREDLMAHHVMFATSKIFSNIYVQELAYWTEGMPWDTYLMNLAAWGIDVSSTLHEHMPMIERRKRTDIWEVGESFEFIEPGVFLSGAWECDRCLRCVHDCPEKALMMREERFIVDAGKCLGTACRRCEEVCPQHLFSYAKLY